MEFITGAVKALNLYGPWAAVVFMGLYLRSRDALVASKDKDLKDANEKLSSVYEKIIKLVEISTEKDTKTEATLSALTRVVERLGLRKEG